MERASESVAVAGLTVQDYLDELPSARDELVREEYGDAFVQVMQDLEAGYKAMAADEEREADAHEWAEGLIRDALA